MALHCKRWLIGVEYAPLRGNVHLQCVAETWDFASARAAHMSLKKALGWTASFTGGSVCCKNLVQSGIHTWLGMIGYCLKGELEDTPERPFRFYSHGVTAEEMALGRIEYQKLGKPNKNQLELTPSNIIDRTQHFASTKLRNIQNPDFSKCVMMMLTSRQYTLGHAWSNPKNSMDPTLCDLVWKSRVSLPSYTCGDLAQTLFGDYKMRYFHGVDHEKTPIGERMDLYDMIESDANDSEGEHDIGSQDTNDDTPFESCTSRGDNPTQVTSQIASRNIGSSFNWDQLQDIRARRLPPSPPTITNADFIPTTCTDHNRDSTADNSPE